MPRTGRGGRREGTPGQAYGNRTDLNANRQAVTAATGQAYGARGAQEAAQRAVPLPAPPPVQAAPAPQAARPPAPAPGTLGAFNRPTDYPTEPLTAGLPVGPGAGPEAVRTGANPNGDVEAQLLALYRAAPNNDVLRLLRTVRAQQPSFQSIAGA